MVKEELWRLLRDDYDVVMGVILCVGHIVVKMLCNGSVEVCWGFGD